LAVAAADSHQQPGEEIQQVVAAAGSHQQRVVAGSRRGVD